MDAIGKANAPIAIASQRQSGKPVQEFLDSIHMIEMANRVLRHRSFPFENASEERFSIETQNLAKVLPHNVR